MILLKRILVATDFSDTSDAALNYGRTLARTFGASLHLLHVMENPFLRPTSRGLKATIGLPHAAEVEVFAKTRALKDAF